MKKSFFSFILALFYYAHPSIVIASDVKPLTCVDLKACISLVMIEDDCEPGCDIPQRPSEYEELPQRFKSFGRAGVDALMPLLEHKHIIVRSKAGDVLSASPFLVASDAPKIFASYRAGNGWLTGAVAHVANESDIANLITEGIANPKEEFGQILHELGVRADPWLIQSLNCSSPSKCEAAANAILESIRYSGRRSEELAKHAFSMAENANLSSKGRGTFLDLAISYAINYADWKSKGPPDEWALMRLRALKKNSDPLVAKVASRALIGFGDSDAVVDALQLVERSQGYDRRMAVMRLGQMGPIAKSAGPKLRERLMDTDWDVRVETASALASIGDEGAVKNLEASINPRDWLLALRAVEALGALDAKTSEAKLLEVSRTYWHEAVREAAKKAMSGAFEGLADQTNVVNNWMNPVQSYCNKQDAEIGLPANFQSLSEEEAISTFNATNEKLWYKNQKLFREHPALAGAVEIKQTIIHNGWTFSGTDKGEWGGDITATSGKKQLKLIDYNSVGLYTSNGKLFAITGVNHMMVSGEFLWHIDFDANSIPVAEIMMRTTGATDFGLKSSNGLVGLYGSSGSMLVHPDGRPEWLNCPTNMLDFPK